MSVIIKISDAELGKLAADFCKESLDEALDIETAVICFTNRVHSTLAARTTSTSQAKIEIDFTKYPGLQARIRAAIERSLNRKSTPDCSSHPMTILHHLDYSPDYLKKLAVQFLQKSAQKNLRTAIEAFTQEIRRSLSTRPSLSPRSDSTLQAHIQTAMTQAYKSWKESMPNEQERSRLKRIDALEKSGLEKLKGAIGLSLFKTIKSLRALKQDSRLLQLSTARKKWEYISQFYPDLTDPNLYFSDFSKTRGDVEKLYLALDPKPHDWFDRLVSITIESNQKRALLDLYDDICRIASSGKLEGTKTYRHLRAVLKEDERIERLIEHVETNLLQHGDRQTLRTEAFFEIVCSFAEYRKWFRGLQLETLSDVADKFRNLGDRPSLDQVKEAFPLSPLNDETRTFLQFGFAASTIENNRLQHRHSFLAIVNAIHPEIDAINDEMIHQWKCLASLAFEELIEKSLIQPAPLPTNVQEAFLQQIQKPKVELSTDDRTISCTEQFARDMIRYKKIVTQDKDNPEMFFPGAYGTTTQARKPLCEQLESLAEGDSDLLSILQECASQTPQNLASLGWLYYDLEAKVKAPIVSFIATLPENTQIAIRKISPDHFIAEYDFKLTLTNQHMMEEEELPIDYHFQKNHSFQIRFEIKKNGEGTWIVNQPSWVGMPDQTI